VADWRDLALFYRSLGQLLQAGVPVTRALTSCGHPELAAHIECGNTFTQALQHSATFPPADLRLLAIAEKSGRLDIILTELAERTDQQIVLRRTVLSGLLLPGIILIVAAFIVPLPKLLIDGTLTGYLVSSIGFLVAILLFILLLLLILRSLSPAALDSLLRPLPLIGSTWREFDYWRLTSSMEMLTNAGLGIIESLRESGDLCRSPRIRAAVNRAADLAETAGEPVSTGLAASGEFPVEMMALWSTGEQSGHLDDMLRRLADQFAERSQTRLQEVARWLPRVVYGLVSLYVIFQILRMAAGYVDLLNSI